MILLRRVVFLVAMLVIVTFWVLFLDNSRLEQSWPRAVQSNPTPPILNGLLFAPVGLRPLSDSVQNPTQLHSKRTLVFVLSDTCKPCVKVAPMWGEFVARMPASRTSLEIISYVGDQLASQLVDVARNRGIGVTSQMVEQRQALMQSSGLSSTPHVLMLDESRRIRFVTVAFDKPIANELSALLAAP